MLLNFLYRLLDRIFCFVIETNFDVWIRRNAFSTAVIGVIGIFTYFVL